MAVENQKLETRCVHAGIEPEPITGSVMTPIFQTSTYAQTQPGRPVGDYEYSRSGNPTRTALEASLAALEGGRFGITFSSGLAAEQAVIQTLQSGDHVIVSDDAYGGTGRLFRQLFGKYGLQFEFLDLRDLAAIERSIKPETKLIWVETPTNPLLKIVDIEAVVSLARPIGAKVLVDNTFCSPILQQPLALGADLVLHSTTKYIAGHSDLVGGAVVTSDEKLAEELRFIQFAAGSVNAPFECFLILRSIKTLALRMKKHSENGLALARLLEDGGAFDKVLYPGLESHPQHALAKRQMSGFSGIITVSLPGGLDRVSRFLTGLKIFRLAESLGGVESLVNHPLTMTHASVPPDMRRHLGIDESLIRFSVGIEDREDLTADIQQALAL